jgi:hypothetical protein
VQHFVKIVGLLATSSALVFVGDGVAADPPVAGTLDLQRMAGTGTLAGGTDELFVGSTSRARAGTSVAFVGDVNGDGTQDYAVGGPLATRGGRVVVVYGPPSASAVTPLASLGERGFRIYGPHTGASAGWSVAGAGDVNGDGFADLLIGAPTVNFTDRGRTGAAYVVFGGSNASVSLRTLGTRGIMLVGATPGDRTGTSVAALPDLDGDGRAELLVGAPGAGATLGRPSAGAAYIVYSAGLGRTVDLGNLGAQGYRIDGAAPGDALGASVSASVDMNGDTRPETLLGAPNAGAGAGAAFAVWGKPATAAATVDLAQLGAQGFAAFGSATERAGTAVAGIRDATGDGVPDMAVGAPNSSWNGRPSSGALYVVQGRGDTFPMVLGTSGLRVGGGDRGEQMGVAVAAAGDVDRDGSADVLVGLGRDAALGRRLAGSALLLLTGRLPRPDADGALLGPAALRFAGLAPGAQSGWALAGGADVNGDGRDDILVGNRRSYSLRGSASLALTPAPPGRPVTPPRGALVATNVEVVVDDSPSMRLIDPGGLMRRQAIEQLLVNPANADRVFGAVEFGSSGHEILPPLRIGDAALAGDRLAVLQALLAERIANDAGATNVEAGLAAAAASNPEAQARIFVTDGGSIRPVTTFGVRTDVIGLRISSEKVKARLTELAQASGGAFYPVTDGGALQSAVAAIDAALRAELTMASTVESAAGVRQAEPEVKGEAAATVTKPGATVVFTATSAPQRARAARSARMVVTWNKRRARFRLTSLRLRAPSGRIVQATPRRLARALHRRRWQPIGHGVSIRGRTGRTFIVLDVRGLDRAQRGARALISSSTWVAGSKVKYVRGRSWVVPRSRWTYQHRPTR